VQAALLTKLFGTRKWHGPCTVVLDADASIQTSGTDAIVNAGVKMFAPRLISGRVAVDAVSYLPEEDALVLVQQVRIRQAGGEDAFQQTVHVADSAHVAAVEFPDGKCLSALGLPEPPPPAVGPPKSRL
jgi:hypothetical protein